MSTQGRHKLAIIGFGVAEAMLLIGTVGTTVTSLVMPITLEVEYIPTVINGMTSATSITIGFLAFLVTFFTGRQKVKVAREIPFRLILYLMWVWMAVMLMVLSYFYLTQSYLVIALRIMLVTFIISASLLADYLYYAMRLTLMSNHDTQTTAH